MVNIKFKLTKNFTGIQDRAGLVFLVMVLNVLGATTSTILLCNLKFIFNHNNIENFLIFIVSDERKVFLRERANKSYSVFSYFIAKTLCELPIFFISVNCFITVLYPSINLNDTFSWKYYAFSNLFFMILTKKFL